VSSAWERLLSKINFLVNEDIWQTLPEIIKSARHVDAAIAYFGYDGANLLPLKRGDRLVVDMSPATVKAGSTNPHEIEKLMARGVEVFTRRNLHAKIVVVDKTVLVGSANVSKNSRDNLDEAAVLTNDPVAVQRAQEFLNRICIGPVLPEYLAECKKLYKPPRITGKQSAKGKSARRAAHAKLWLVNLVDDYSVPDAESGLFEKSEAKARRLVDTAQSVLDTFHWPHKHKMADELETGDWVIECVRHKDKSVSVYPPARFLSVDHYIRNQQTGKERYLFHLEMPKRGETLSWAKFRKALKSILDVNLSQPRTMPVRDTQKADDLLRLWTPKGRVSRK
jgi:hypothetical protein